MKFSKEFSDALGFKSFQKDFHGFLEEFPIVAKKMFEIHEESIVTAAMKCITIITDIGIDPETYKRKELTNVNSQKERLAKFRRMERERHVNQKQASEISVIDSSSTTDDVTELSVEFERKPMTLPPMKRSYDSDEIERKPMTLPLMNRSLDSDEIERKPMNLPPMKRSLDSGECKPVDDKNFTQLAREKEQIQVQFDEEKEQMKGLIQKMEVMNENFSTQIKKQNQVTLNQCKEIDNLNIQKNTLEKKVTSLHNDLTKSIALNNDLRAKNQSLIEKYNGIVKFSDRVKSEKNDLIVFMRKMKWF